MSLLKYLKNRTIFFFALIVSSTLIGFMLKGIGLNVFAIAYCILVLWVIGAAALLADYFHRRWFYQQLADNLAATDKEGYLVPTMLDEPSTLEERLFRDALSSMSKSMMDKLADEHMRSKEYREYIEMWVHEIKTPIAAAHLVAQNNPSLPMDDVQTQLTKIESLIEQALFYARSASVDRDFSIRDVNLQLIVKDALKNNTRVFIDAGVSPHFDDLDHVVKADPKWLEFILRQLLVNAAKYSNPELAPGEKNVWISVSVSEPREGTTSTTLFIKDNGIGIPEEDLSRIFDKGFTGQNGRKYAKSTGMGLYLCYELCKKMGLKLAVSSTIGKGSTFSITFNQSFTDLK